MRDERGFYRNTKPIEELAPGWAKGCGACSHGIISAPELTGACELYLERLVQAIDGDIQFCTCKAGTRYRVFLQNRFLFLKAEAKRDIRMVSFAAANTHPDIESARRAMQSGYEYVKAPSIRWVGDDIPVPPEAQAETVVTP